MWVGGIIFSVLSLWVVKSEGQPGCWGEGCLPDRATPNPTERPTKQPTKNPTKNPTPQPTHRPTKRPTPEPTKRPTPKPTKRPTRRPTPEPTRRPTNPTANPVSQPDGPSGSTPSQPSGSNPDPAPTGGGAPSSPTAGGTPSAPAGGGSPSTPTGSGTPATPTGGGTPSAPSGGGSPSVPSGGGAPSAPSGGGAPSTPTEEGVPSAPSGGGVPSAPSGGGAPSAPSGGGAPSTPTEGGVPSAPSGGGAPSAPSGGSPNPSPSLATVTPSTSAPTFNPTSTPALVCTVTGQDEIFGSPGVAGTVVEYPYEITTTSGVDADTVNSEIAPPIEEDLSTVVLPILFPAQCESPRARARKLEYGRRRLDAVGYNSQQPDVVLPDVPCAQSADSNNCYVMNGTLTVLTSTEEELDPEIVQAILRVIGDYFSSGESGVDDPRVVSTTYVGKEEPPTEETTSSDGSSIPGYVWAIIGIGIVVPSVAAFFHLRRRRGDQIDRGFVADEDEENVMADEAVVAPEKPPPVQPQVTVAESDDGWVEDKSWVSSDGEETMSIDFGEYMAMQEGMQPKPAVDDENDEVPFEDAVSEPREGQEIKDTGD